MNSDETKKAAEINFGKHVHNPFHLVIIDQNIILAHFQQNLKISQMEIFRCIIFTKYVGEVPRDMYVKFCVPGLIHSVIIDT